MVEGPTRKEKGVKLSFIIILIIHVIINPTCNCLLSENLLPCQPKNRKLFRVSTLKYYSYITTVVYKQQYANYRIQPPLK